MLRMVPGVMLVTNCFPSLISGSGYYLQTKALSAGARLPEGSPYPMSLCQVSCVIGRGAFCSTSHRCQKHLLGGGGGVTKEGVFSVIGLGLWNYLPPEVPLGTIASGFSRSHAAVPFLESFLCMRFCLLLLLWFFLLNHIDFI